MKKYTLLSIKPRHTKPIFTGEKKFEFRKKIPNFKDNDIMNKVIVYCSKPETKIIGSFEVAKIHDDNFDNIMKIIEANEEQKISLSYYFTNKDICHALKIKNFILYENPLTLNEIRKKIDSNFTPGQNYRYLNEDSAIINEIKKTNIDL